MAQDTSANNKQIAKNTIFLYLRMIVVLFLQFYISRKLLATLGVADYGTYNLVAGFVSMFTFFTSSLSNGYQRFFNFALGKKDYEQYTKILSNALIIQMAAIAVLTLILETIGLWALNTKLNIPSERLHAANMVFQGVIIMIASNMVRAPFQAVVISHQKMNFFAIVSVLEVVANLGVVIMLEWVDADSLILYAFLHPLVVILATITYILYSKNNYEYVKIKARVDVSNLREIASFSGWNLFGSFAHMLQSQGVDIVINIYYGVTVNAARGIANQVKNGLNNLSSNFLMASRPQIIQSYSSGDEKRTVSLSNNVARLSFMLLWLFALPTIFNINWLLELWLGSNVPEKAPIFCIISIFIGLVSAFTTPTSTIVHATGKMKKFQIITSFAILLTVPVAYITQVFNAPAEAVLFAVLFVQIFAQIIRIYLIRDLITFSALNYLTKTITPTILVVLLSVSLSYVYIQSTEFKSVINFLSIILINVFCILLLGMNKKERQLLRTAIISKIRRYK